LPRSLSVLTSDGKSVVIPLEPARDAGTLLKVIKKRLHKKMHRRWLDFFGDEISFSPHWRKLLFESAERVAYPIDANHLCGLKPDAIAFLKKYDLRFYAERANPDHVPEALLAGVQEDGLVPFRVWAADYPWMEFWTANNPDVISW